MTQTMLDERYGRTRSKRRRVLGWALVAIVATIGVAGLTWATLANTVTSADASATAFTIVDQRSVAVTFQVTVPSGNPVTCVLEADDDQHGIVGWRIVSYPPSDAHTRVFTETIPTIGLATTGLVNICWVA